MNLNLNKLLHLCSGEGADDAFGSSTRDTDRQPSDLGGDGTGTQSLKSVNDSLGFFSWT